jgi:hypothetical protein
LLAESGRIRQKNDFRKPRLPQLDKLPVDRPDTETKYNPDMADLMDRLGLTPRRPVKGTFRVLNTLVIMFNRWQCICTDDGCILRATVGFSLSTLFELSAQIHLRIFDCSQQGTLDRNTNQSKGKGLLVQVAISVSYSCAYSIMIRSIACPM